MEIKRLIVGNLQTNCYLLVSGNELGIIDPEENKGKAKIHYQYSLSLRPYSGKSGDKERN